MPGLYRPSYSDKTLDGKTVKKRASKWYGWYKHPDTGKTVRVPLSEDKAVAQQLLARIIADLERGKHGLVDPYAEHRKRPLTEHVEDYRQDMANREISPAQVKQVCSRILRVLDLAGLKLAADITPAKVQAAIAHLRRVENRSAQTCNFYLQSIKQFCRWLVRETRMESNPIAYLQGGNVKLDRRHDRRELGPDQLAALIEAAHTGGVVCRMAGPNRAMLYLTSAATGLRASELASLTPESFALDADPPTVTVAAAYSKHRRQDTLPLHPALIPALREWLAGKPRGERVWPGKWAKGKEGSTMMRADLARAGIPYRDERGLFADFHALRHTFISHLAKSNVPPKLAQVLARHSTITLTMDRYAHVEFREQAEVMRTLPPVMGGGLEPACNGLATEGRQEGREEGCDPLPESVGDVNEGCAGPLTQFSRPAQSATLAPLRPRKRGNQPDGDKPILNAA
jgi:integrase